MASASAKMRILKKKIERAVFQAQKKAARELVDILIQEIKNRVRILRETVSGKQFDDLDPKYIERRKKAKNLSKETFPDSSNATATGQMIDAMRGKASGSKISIVLKDDRKRELGGYPSRVGNNKVREEYEKKMGEWFELQQGEKDRAIDHATEIIKEEIKNVLK